MSGEEIAELNYLLHKYGITSTESITLFFATCGHESNKGNSVIELPNDDGTTVGNNTVENRGAGYIQLTHEDSQKQFLKSIGDSYNGTDLAEYISRNYAWESACWFWSSEDAKETIAGSIDDYVVAYGDSIGVFLLTQYWVNGWQKGLSSVSEGIRDETSLWKVSNNRLYVNGVDICAAPIGWNDRKWNYDDAIEIFK